MSISELSRATSHQESSNPTQTKASSSSSLVFEQAAPAPPHQHSETHWKMWSKVLSMGFGVMSSA